LGISGKHIKKKEHPRERTYTDAEIVRIIEVARPVDVADLFMLALATGARDDQLRSMRFEHVKAGVWTCPPSLHKTGKKTRKPMVLPLNEVALEVLRRRGLGSTIGHVFPGRKPGTHYHRPGRELAKAGRAAGLGGPLRLHDVRRTCAQRMADLEIPPHVIDAALGHELTPLQQTYMPKGVAPSLVKAAFEAWGKVLSDVCQGSPRANKPEVGARVVSGPSA
jgi:integrase